MSNKIEELKKEIQSLEQKLDEFNEDSKEFWPEMNKFQRADAIREREKIEEVIEEKENELQELEEILN